MDDIARRSARHDFDFLFGSWTCRHRRLDRRLAGETHWTDSEGTTVARPLFGGFGNIDENVLELPSGRYEAATIRLFDESSGQWSIWWLDTRFPGFDAPMVGAFAGGIGTFYGDVVHDGRPARVRFLWSDIEADSAQWAQAYSVDDGLTWETNWIMNFTRTG